MNYAMEVLKEFGNSWPLTVCFVVLMGGIFINWNIRRMVRSEERKNKEDNRKAIELARINRKEIAAVAANDSRRN